MIRQPLEPKSHVETEKNASVKILFSDGSIGTIGQNSDFEINGQEINGQEFNKGLQLNTLHAGHAHATIQKKVEEASRKKLKF